MCLLWYKDRQVENRRKNNDYPNILSFLEGILDLHYAAKPARSNQSYQLSHVSSRLQLRPAASKPFFKILFKRRPPHTREQPIMNLTLGPNKLSTTLHSLDQEPKVHRERAILQLFLLHTLRSSLPHLVHLFDSHHTQLDFLPRV